MQYQITLLAGVPKRQDMSGTTFVLLETGAAPQIDLSIDITGAATEKLYGVKRGLKINLPSPGFTSAIFTAPVDCTLQVVATLANLSVNYQDGNAVNATIMGLPTVHIDPAQLPMAVVPDRGAPGNPVYTVGATISDAPAVTLQDNAAVAVTSAGAVLVAASTTRRSLRFCNIGTDPVALGFTGITWNKRCIVLSPNDSYIEDRAANMTWSAICDVAKTATVTVQEVMA